MLSVTLPELDATSLSIRSTERGHLRRELAEVRGRGVDVGAVGLEDLAQLLREDQDVVDDPGQPFLAEGAAQGLLEVRGDVADVDLDVPGELRDLVEGDRRFALESRAFRQRGRGDRPGNQLDVLVAQHPEALDGGRGALAQGHVPGQLEVDDGLAPDQADLGDLAHQHARHAHVGFLLEARDVVELDGDAAARSAAEVQVLDLPDEDPREDECDQKKRSDFRCLAHRASEMVLPLALSDSTVNGPSARPSTNCRTAGSLRMQELLRRPLEQDPAPEQQRQAVADLPRRSECDA